MLPAAPDRELVVCSAGDLHSTSCLSSGTQHYICVHDLSAVCYEELPLARRRQGRLCE